MQANHDERKSTRINKFGKIRRMLSLIASKARQKGQNERLRKTLFTEEMPLLISDKHKNWDTKLKHANVKCDIFDSGIRCK